MNKKQHSFHKNMQKIYLFIILILPISLMAQSIDQSYLDSLPDDIKEDVLNRVNEKEGREEATYRSINSASDLQKDKKKIDPSERLFGEDFFNTFQTSFMPINVPNLDDSYILDFGDVLNIQLIGQIDSQDTYAISRDGSINISEVGKLNLAGLSLNKASELISSKIKQTFIGTDSYTSLKEIKDVNILVSGDAFNPGIYTLSGNSNMLHALNVAGGIGEHGSYREIRLIRNGEIIEKIDIYNILNNGILNSNKRLKSGDVIFVAPRKNVVTVDGAFKRVAKYELLDDQKLSDAISYANGISVDADYSNVFIYRMIEGKIQALPIVNIFEFDSIKSKDQDRIFIRKHSFRNVKISGAVLRPGTYKMVEGEEISDLLNKAGGFTSNAFPEGAIYLNEEAKKINQDASNKLYENFIEGLLEFIQKSSNGEADITSLVQISSELKDVEPNGRIIVDLLDESFAVKVRNLDSLFIPEKTNNIFVYGEVANEGGVLYKNGADLEYYLNEGSGLKSTAEESSIYILYPNGRTKQLNRKRNLFASQPQQIDITPGSVIYIPRKIDDALQNRMTAQAYATILGNIGVTLASLSVLNEN